MYMIFAIKIEGWFPRIRQGFAQISTIGRTHPDRPRSQAVYAIVPPMDTWLGTRFLVTS